MDASRRRSPSYDDPAVLKAISTRDGNLPQLNATNAAVANVLDRYQKRSEEQATVYISCLPLGPDRKLLTPEQADYLAQHALHYAEQIPAHAGDAFKIDKAIDGKGGPDQAACFAGARRYLQTGAKAIDPTRRHQLKTFARALSKETQDFRTQKKPLISLMQYISYAPVAKLHPAATPENKTAGSRTKWLCIFAQAVLRAMGRKPQFESFAISLINDEPDAPVAEMVLTRLSHAYYFAGGFNISQSGSSLASIKLQNFTEKKRKEYCDANVAWVKNPANTGYRLNQELELERRHRYKKSSFGRMIADRMAKLQKCKDEVHEMDKNVEETMEDMNEERWRKLFPEQLKGLYLTKNHVEMHKHL